MNIFAAASDAEADYLASSHRQWMLDLHVGRFGLLPKPQEGYVQGLPAHERAVLEQVMACTIAGGPQRVREGLQALIGQTGADELMIDCRIHDPLARQRSHALVAQAIAEL